MKKNLIFAALLLGCMLFVSLPVEAKHHRCHRRNSFSVNFGGFAPAYYCPPPAPVYMAPPAYYYPPCPQPVYVVAQPQPCYVQPGFSFGWSFFR